MQRRRKKMDEKLIYAAQLRKLENTEKELLDKLLDALHKGNKSATIKAVANFLGLKYVAQITELPLLSLVVFTNIKDGGKRKIIIFGLAIPVYIIMTYSIFWNHSVEYILVGCLIALLESMIMTIGVYTDKRLGLALSSL